MNAVEEEIVHVYAVRARETLATQLAAIVTEVVTVEHLDAYIPVKQLTYWITYAPTSSYRVGVTVKTPYVPVDVYTNMEFMVPSTYKAGVVGFVFT